MALGLFGLGRRGMNKEKSHMQGYAFLKFFFLCFLLSKQSKSDRKNHTERQIQKIQPSFLEQNKLLETTRKCHFQCKCSTSLSSFPCLSNSWSHHRVQLSPTHRSRSRRGRGGKVPINHTWDLLFQPDSWSCFGSFRITWKCELGVWICRN